LSLIDNPPPSDDEAPLPPELSPFEGEPPVVIGVGAKVGAVGPVGVASSCSQNPFKIDVAEAMSAWEVLHPVAATEEAAEIAEEN